MDAVTYSNHQVVEFINEYLIPFRVSVNDELMFEKYYTFWTPTTAIIGLKGMNVQGKHEVQRMIGFLAPEDFLPTLHLGIAKVRLDQQEFDTAKRHFDLLLEGYPNSEAVPEAIYFRGVSLYKQHNDPGRLKEALETLQRENGGSRWAKRAQPYGLL